MSMSMLHVLVHTGHGNGEGHKRGHGRRRRCGHGQKHGQGQMKYSFLDSLCFGVNILKQIEANIF